MVETSSFLLPSRLPLRLQEPEVVDVTMEKSLSLPFMEPPTLPEFDLNSAALATSRPSNRIPPEVHSAYAVSTLVLLKLIEPEPVCPLRSVAEESETRTEPEDALVSRLFLTVAFATLTLPELAFAFKLSHSISSAVTLPEVEVAEKSLHLMELDLLLPEELVIVTFPVEVMLVAFMEPLDEIMVTSSDFSIFSTRELPEEVLTSRELFFKSLISMLPLVA